MSARIINELTEIARRNNYYSKIKILESGDIEILFEPITIERSIQKAAEKFEAKNNAT